MVDHDDLEFVMSLISVGGMTPEGCASVDGREISWKFTLGSTTTMEVSVSSKMLAYWSGWQWDSSAMKIDWIGIGNPSTEEATLSTCQTLYAFQRGRWRLVSMNLKRGFPTGGSLNCLPLDMDVRNN